MHLNTTDVHTPGAHPAYDLTYEDTTTYISPFHVPRNTHTIIGVIVGIIVLVAILVGVRCLRPWAKRDSRMKNASTATSIASIWGQQSTAHFSEKAIVWSQYCKRTENEMITLVVLFVEPSPRSVNKGRGLLASLISNSNTYNLLMLQHIPHLHASLHASSLTFQSLLQTQPA